MKQKVIEYIKWSWWKGIKPFSIHFWKEIILKRFLNVSIIAIAIPLIFDNQISNVISDTKRDSVKKVNDLENFELFRKEMIEMSISIDILYELLNNNKGNEKDIGKKIDKKYENLEKNIDDFYNNFDRNIRIIRKTVRKEKIKKRKCGSKPMFISESECSFKKVETSLKEVNEILKSAYDSYKKNDKRTDMLTLAHHRPKIKKIQTDVTLFLDSLNEN